MLDLLLIVVVIELAIIILAWPEAREIASELVGFAVIGILIAAMLYFDPFQQMRRFTPSWRNVEVVATLVGTIIICVAGFVVCAMSARGWVGERLLMSGRPDQVPLYFLLALLSGVVLMFSSLFLTGGLGLVGNLDSEDKLKWTVGGAIGDLLVLIWIIAGLRMRRRRRELEC